MGGGNRDSPVGVQADQKHQAAPSTKNPLLGVLTKKGEPIVVSSGAMSPTPSVLDLAVRAPITRLNLDSGSEAASPARKESVLSSKIPY